MCYENRDRQRPWRRGAQAAPGSVSGGKWLRGGQLRQRCHRIDRLSDLCGAGRQGRGLRRMRQGHTDLRHGHRHFDLRQQDSWRSLSALRVLYDLYDGYIPLGLQAGNN